MSCLLFGLTLLPSVESAVLAVLPAAARSVGALAVAAADCLAVATLAFWITRRSTERSLRTAHDGLNLMGVALLALNLVGVVRQQSSERWQPAVAALASSVRSPVLHAGYRPDIYYNILDGYARDDVLSERYGMPDNALTNYLTSKDFYLADRSQANYAQTYPSLASSLNMTYLAPLAAVM